MAKGKFFKKLFAKQPGGSVVGNLLRGVGDKFTGGAISKIFPTKSATTVPTNTGIANLTTQPTGEKMTLIQKLKANMAYTIGGVVAVALVAWYFLKPKKYGKRRY